MTEKWLEINLTALLIVAFLILNSGVGCCMATVFLPPVSNHRFLSPVSNHRFLSPVSNHRFLSPVSNCRSHWLPLCRHEPHKSMGEYCWQAALCCTIVVGLELTLCPMCQVLGIHGFAFPLLLTSCHMGFSFVVLLPFMLCKPYVGRHRATLEQQWKGLVAIGEAACPLACLRCMACSLLWLRPLLCPSGLFLAANISLNNLSLVLITLSLNQIIRSARQHCRACCRASACAREPQCCHPPLLPPENAQVLHGFALAVETHFKSC